MLINLRAAYRVGQKRGHRLMTTILSNLNRFTIFFTGRFFSKFAVKDLKVTGNLQLRARFVDIYVLQGSVATYARCDGILNTRLTGNLL